MKVFFDFMREQGVVGLAIGFILGGAVSGLVGSFVEDIINPIIGIALGKAGSLSDAVLTIGSVEIAWGSFITVLIDFVVIALVVYFGFKALRLDKLDKPKEKGKKETKAKA
jgi:large conductance mechanosensitive channel